MPSMSDSADGWQFQFRGMERESDGPYYYTGAGQFYSAQIARSFSLTGAQSASGPGGSGGYSPAGRSLPPMFTPAGHESYWQWVESEDTSALEGTVSISSGEGSGGVPVGGIIYGIESLISFFEWAFGGSAGLPPNYFVFKARLERAKRHPLYIWFDGIPGSIVINLAPAITLDLTSNTPPLQRPGNSQQGIIAVQFWSYNACGPGNNGRPTGPGTVDNCCNAHDSCYESFGLSAGNMAPPGSSAPVPQRACDSQLCGCVGSARVAGPLDYLMRFEIREYFKCQ